MKPNMELVTLNEDIDDTLINIHQVTVNMLNNQVDDTVE